MRISVLIIGLVLMLGLFVQSLTISALSGIAENDSAGAGAAIGLLMATLWLIGCAVVLPKPRVAMVIFAAAAVLGFAGGTSTVFGDLVVWAFVSLGLAVLSFFGWRGKRAEDREKAAERAVWLSTMERNNRLEAEMNRLHLSDYDRMRSEAERGRAVAP